MKISALAVATLLLAGCANQLTTRQLANAFAEYGEPMPSGTIVAEVQVLEDHISGLSPPCPIHQDCQPPIWHTYKARVIRVLSGQSLSREILFGNLQQESFAEPESQPMYVFLRPGRYPVQDQLKVDFLAYRVLFCGRRRCSGG